MNFDKNGNRFLTLKDKDLPNMMLLCKKKDNDLYLVEFTNVKRQEADTKVEYFTFNELNQKFKPLNHEQERN